MSAPAIVGLDHVVLRVADLARAERFYQEVLGLRVERRVESLGLVQMRAGRSMIDLQRRDKVSPAEPRTRNLDHFAVRLATFDEGALRAHLDAHGVPAGPVRRLYGAEGDGPAVYIEDPDGNVIELKGPPG